MINLNNPIYVFVKEFDCHLVFPANFFNIYLPVFNELNNSSNVEALIQWWIDRNLWLLDFGRDKIDTRWTIEISDVKPIFNASRYVITAEHEDCTEDCNLDEYDIIFSDKIQTKQDAEAWLFNYKSRMQFANLVDVKNFRVYS